MAALSTLTTLELPLRKNASARTSKPSATRTRRQPAAEVLYAKTSRLRTNISLNELEERIFRLSVNQRLHMTSQLRHKLSNQRKTMLKTSISVSNGKSKTPPEDYASLSSIKNTLRLLAFTDASFANNRDLSSQIGYVLVLADGTGRANILHWSSTKCKRVTRSVLASELYGMVYGFDMGASVKSTVDKMLGIELPLVVYTDSKSLYECLVKLGTTQEKRLIIDVMCLRQAYERREIAEVKWIKGNTNPADAITKSKPSNALKLLIDTNTLQLDVEEWVKRE